MDDCVVVNRQFKQLTWREMVLINSKKNGDQLITIRWKLDGHRLCYNLTLNDHKYYVLLDVNVLVIQ